MGRDGGDFVINELGEMRFRSSPDFERPVDSDRDNVYELMVRAYDGRVYGTLEDPIEITGTQVNEAPVITTKSRTSFSLRENSTSNIYTYRATDPEGDEFTWGLGGPDASYFEISEQGALTFAAPPDYGSPAGSGSDANQYLVTIEARDDQGNAGELPVTVTVTGQNEGATVTRQNSIAVVENRAPNLVLATYSAVDPEGESSLAGACRAAMAATS